MMKSLTRLLIVAAAFISASPAIADHHCECSRDDAAAGDSIVETAASAGQFETLLAAATEAGLASALANDGPFTVFAPTDTAFGTLPAGTVKTLLQAGNRDKLADILKFHVVPGRVGSGALADGASLKTLAGPRMTFAATEQGFAVEGARIISTDIEASNGIIHVIDRVMTPPESLSRTRARRAIEGAIARGVPMFNQGNPTGTVRIYTRAAETLVAAANLESGERERLQQGLSAAENSESSRESAWQLRYALDEVLESLQENPVLASHRVAGAR